MSFGFGVGDVLSVYQFATQVYESCSKAPQQFAELRNQVKSIINALEVFNDHLTSRRLSLDQEAELRSVIDGFKPILSELSALIARRQKLQSGRLELWNRMRWPSNQKLNNLRLRLTDQLNIFQTRLLVELFRVPQQIGWHMFPLKDLARVLIPREQLTIKRRCEPLADVS